MRRSLADTPVFAISRQEGGHIVLSEARGARVHIFVLEDDIIRVAVLPDGGWKMPSTWAVTPGGDDVPAEGRLREDISGFSCPPYVLSEERGILTIETARLRVSVKLAGFSCRWALKRGDDWVPIARDRFTQAYDFGWWDGRVRHYLARPDSEKFFGLGEVSGDMDRVGRRIRLSGTDALGYSARSSDPLYKSVPFYITYDMKTKTAFGLFYDTLSDCAFDFGCERSNYHGRYRLFEAEHGDLDYYVIAGPEIADVTRRFTWMTGRPAFMPKWSLGYSGSTMSYTDAPDAQARMDEFLAKCAEHDILCSSFHLSSGYTSIGAKRYVFNWNRDKFPDPAGFVANYAAHGVKLAPNIKPALLRDHPLYDECAREGFFINDELGQPLLVYFWDALGSYVDFTNPRAADWWTAQVRRALLDVGMAATWNDNNEYEFKDPAAEVALFGKPRAAVEMKSLQSLLMLKASRAAQLAHAPEKRPYLVTRAGGAGVQRYAQTWSGDNATAWETVKYNIKMGLSSALSGVSNTGHDVGGFAGPAPDAELFLRWVEFGIFMPRFSIHSWNDDGTVNEPWMHPSITAHVRDLIKFRARLEPYLYDLAYRSHCDYEPMVRPTFFEFPDDPRTFEENDEMMLGSSLLVAPVVEAGQTERRVYLPAGADWYDFWRGEMFEGGREVTVPAVWGKPPFFARAGSIIPANFAEQHFARSADERGFFIFPRVAGHSDATCFEDDGETFAFVSGRFAQWSVLVEADAALRIGVSRSGSFGATPKTVKLVLPVSERRSVTLLNARLVHDVASPEGRVLEVAF
ncbi:MAG: alpha-glucosidase [Alphaproteobacteria bacterium]|nr:alpha-glucosidase [Alphaproteobacteria bacterium]